MAGEGDGVVVFVWVRGWRAEERERRERACRENAKVGLMLGGRGVWCGAAFFQLEECLRVSWYAFAGSWLRP